MKYLALLFLLTACGPAFHLRQAQKHIKKALLKGAVANVDTFYVDREIIVPSIKFDTVTAYKTLTDTIRIVKNGIVTKIKVDTVNRDIFVETECPPKIVTVRVPYTVTTEIKTGFQWWWFVVVAVVCLALGLFVRR